MIALKSLKKAKNVERQKNDRYKKKRTCFFCFFSAFLIMSDSLVPFLSSGHKPRREWNREREKDQKHQIESVGQQFEAIELKNQKKLLCCTVKQEMTNTTGKSSFRRIECKSKIQDNACNDNNVNMRLFGGKFVHFDTI